jgi:hypothetical protein
MTWMFVRFVVSPLVLIGLAIVGYEYAASPMLGVLVVLGSALGGSGLLLKRNRGER